MQVVLLSQRLGGVQADERVWGSGPGPWPGRSLAGPAGGSRAWRLEVRCISLTSVDGSVFLEVLRGSPCLLRPCQCRAWPTPVPSRPVTISTPDLSFPSGQSCFDVSKCTDASPQLRVPCGSQTLRDRGHTRPLTLPLAGGSPSAAPGAGGGACCSGTSWDCRSPTEASSPVPRHPPLPWWCRPAYLHVPRAPGSRLLAASPASSWAQTALFCRSDRGVCAAVPWGSPVPPYPHLPEGTAHGPWAEFKSTKST